MERDKWTRDKKREGGIGRMRELEGEREREREGEGERERVRSIKKGGRTMKKKAGRISAKTEQVAFLHVE